MTENKFEKQVAKEDYQDANAEYKGLDAKPKPWEKDGKSGVIAKTRWLIEGKEHENKFTIFFPLTSNKAQYKTLEELEQFKMYYIGWFEENKKFEDKEWVDKKIVNIGEYSATKVKEQRQDQEAQTEDLRTEIDKYTQAVKAEGLQDLTLADFIANFYAAQNPKALEYLQTKYNEIN